MADPRKSNEHVSTNKAVSSVDNDQNTEVDPIDPSALGFTKVAYAVDETLELLSIGRTALYAAVKRGDLKRVKFGKKTLFYAADLAAFLTRLRQLSETDESRVDHKPRQMQDWSSRLLKKYSTDFENGYVAVVIDESDLDQALAE
jgi:excisionase family DNA binding protein